MVMHIIVGACASLRCGASRDKATSERWILASDSMCYKLPETKFRDLTESYLSVGVPPVCDTYLLA